MTFLVKAMRVLVPVVVIGGAMAAAVPAQAAPCTNAGYLCFWVNSGYSGEKGKVVGDNSNFTKLKKSSGGSWNDVISSAYNDGTSDSVALFQNAGGSAGEPTQTNWSVCFHRGTGNSNFVNVNDPYTDTGDFNDQASANSWYTPTADDVYWCGWVQ